MSRAARNNSHSFYPFFRALHFSVSLSHALSYQFARLVADIAALIRQRGAPGQSPACSDAILFVFVAFCHFFVAVFGCGFVALYRMPLGVAPSCASCLAIIRQSEIYIRHANTCSLGCTYQHTAVYTTYSSIYRNNVCVRARIAVLSHLSQAI